jgi:hypothetical protein
MAKKDKKSTKKQKFKEKVVFFDEESNEDEKLDFNKEYNKLVKKLDKQDDPFKKQNLRKQIQELFKKFKKSYTEKDILKEDDNPIFSGSKDDDDFKSNCMKCKKILEENNIKSHKQFLKWSIKNHPDKFRKEGGKVFENAEKKYKNIQLCDNHYFGDKDIYKRCPFELETEEEKNVREKQEKEEEEDFEKKVKDRLEREEKIRKNEAQEREKYFLLENKDLDEDELIQSFSEFIANDEYFQENFKDDVNMIYINNKIKEYETYEIGFDEKTLQNNFFNAYKYEKDANKLLEKFQAYIENQPKLKLKFKGKKPSILTVKYYINKNLEKEEKNKIDTEETRLKNFIKSLNDFEERDVLEKKFNEFLLENTTFDKNIFDKLLESGKSSFQIKLIFQNYFEQYDMDLETFINISIERNDTEEDRLRIFLTGLKFILEKDNYNLIKEEFENFKENNYILFGKDVPENLEVLFNKIFNLDFYLFKKLRKQYLNQYMIEYDSSMDFIKNRVFKEALPLKSIVPLEQFYNIFMESKEVQNYLENEIIRKTPIERKQKENSKNMLLELEKNKRKITYELNQISVGSITDDIINKAEDELYSSLIKIRYYSLDRKISEYAMNNKKYIIDLVDIIKKESKNAKDFVSKIENILIFLSSTLNSYLDINFKKYISEEFPILNNFKENIHNFYYNTPEALAVMTENDKINDKLSLFYNNIIPKKETEKLLQFIKKLKTKYMKTFFISIYKNKEKNLNRAKEEEKEEKLESAEEIKVEEEIKFEEEDLAPDFFNLLEQDMENIERKQYNINTDTSPFIRREFEIENMMKEDIKQYPPSLDNIFEEDVPFEYSPVSDNEYESNKDYIGFYYDTFIVKESKEESIEEILDPKKLKFKSIEFQKFIKDAINDTNDRLKNISKNNKKLQTQMDSLKSIQLENKIKKLKEDLIFDINRKINEFENPHYELMTPDQKRYFYNNYSSNDKEKEEIKEKIEKITYQMKTENPEEFENIYKYLDDLSKEKIKIILDSLKKQKAIKEEEINNLEKDLMTIPQKEKDEQHEKYNSLQRQTRYKTFEDIMKQKIKENQESVKKEHENDIKKIINDISEKDKYVIDKSVEIIDDLIKNDRSVYKELDRQKIDNMDKDPVILKILNDMELVEKLKSQGQDSSASDDIRSILIEYIDNYENRNLNIKKEHRYFIIFRKDPLYISCLYDFKNNKLIDKEVLVEDILENKDDIEKDLKEYISKNGDNIFASLYLKEKQLEACSYSDIQNSLKLISDKNPVSETEKAYDPDNQGPLIESTESIIEKYINNVDSSLSINVSELQVNFDSDNKPYFTYEGHDYIGKKEDDSGDSINEDGSIYSIESEDSNISLDDNDNDNLEKVNDIELEDNNVFEKSSNIIKEDNIIVNEDNNRNSVVICVNCQRQIKKDNALKTFVAINNTSSQEIYFCCFKCFELYEKWPSSKKLKKTN